MPLHAVLFGAIGAIVETSEIQRAAFNTAFRNYDVDIFWDRAEYELLLHQPGGRVRIAKALEASGMNDETLVDAIYNEKTALFLDDLKAGIEPRPGVLNLLEQAGQAGLAVGFVSGTDRQVVDAVIEGAVGVSPKHFDLILSGTDAKNAKPNPEIYDFALEQLGLEAQQCVAIEDTVSSGRAAMAAGIPVLFTPGAMTQREDWGLVDGQIANLESLGVGPIAIDALQIWHADQLSQKAA
ncbi:MAG: HAD-IA family hydrolase [Hyphomicrobiales bacterium]|jgi:HAD superfamily hydrolase (TIGR01509 family)